MKITCHVRRMKMHLVLLLAAAIGWAGNIGLLEAEPTDQAGGILFRESFDDARLLDRGWYDGQTFAITPEGAFAGKGCIAYRWKRGMPHLLDRPPVAVGIAATAQAPAKASTLLRGRKAA